MRTFLFCCLLAVAAAIGVASCGRLAPFEEPGDLVVTSTPEGATILLDGGDTGEVTPHTFRRLAAGDYVVTVALPELVTIPGERKVHVGLGTTTTTDFALMENVGALAVRSAPTGASILLDGVDTGAVTDTVLTGLEPRTYVVTVTLPNHTAIPPQDEIEVLIGDTVSTVAFELAEEVGQLTVISTPAGADVVIDGQATGETTPHTFTLSPGLHTVEVALAGYVSIEGELEVNVLDDETATVDFTLQPAARKAVLLESFSNVSCVGCPEMAERIEELMLLPGYGRDRLLAIKYSANFPYPVDPHFLANPADNDARFAFYGYSSLPALYIDGERFGTAGQVPPLVEMQAAVDERLALPPVVGIDIVGAPDDTSYPAQITVTAVDGVDLTGHTLLAVLVEEEILYDEPPGSQDWTDYHWVMLDVETVAADLGEFAAEESQEFTSQLTIPTSPSFVVDQPHVLVIVQNSTTKAVVQTASNIPISGLMGSTDSSPAGSLRSQVPSPEGKTR